MKKLFKRLHCSQKGFSHHLLIPIAVVLAVTGTGVYLLYKSHADQLPAQLKGLPVPIYTWIVGPSGFQSNTQGGGIAGEVHDTVLSSKSGANTVWYLKEPGSTGPASVNAEIGTKDFTTRDYIASHYKGHKSMTCAYVRTNALQKGEGFSVFGMGFSSRRFDTLNKGYQDVCTPIEDMTTQPMASNVDVMMEQGTAPQDLYVAHMTVYVF